MAKLVTHWINKGAAYYCVRQWVGASESIGVIHILHGMMEHSGMYHNWANKLCELGWDVVCHDQPSAGYTIHPDCDRDHLPRNGVEILIESTRVIDEWIREEYPQKKCIRYGHSMGAFLALNLEQKKVSSDGLILTGATTEPSFLLHIQRPFLKLMGAIFGQKSFARLAHAISITPLNKSFKPNASPHDWVTRMPALLNQYITDPLCGNMATWGFYFSLNNLILEMNQSAVPLPHTLFITGDMDALSTGGKKLDGFIKRLMGVATSVSHIVVPGARHKVECDQESTMILEEIKTFMDQL